jgi:hypothetical protein
MHVSIIVVIEYSNLQQFFPILILYYIMFGPGVTCKFEEGMNTKTKF